MLARTPHLACLVNGLCLWCDNDTDSAVELPRNLARSLLRTCPNVAAFRLHHIWFDEAEAVATELRQGDIRLEELEIDMTSILPALLSRPPLLRNLRLGDCDDNFTFGVPSFPFQLKSLRTQDLATRGAHEAFEELLHVSHSTLRHLDLRISVAADISLHLPRIPAPSHHKLYARFGERGSNLPDQLSEALSKCARLQSLHLVDLAHSPPSQVARLPLQLHKINFGARVPQESISTLLSDESRGVLRQVKMDKSGDEKWEELGKEHSWSVERFGKKVVFTK